MPSLEQTSGMVPSLLDLARAGDALDVLRAACRDRGDEITFAATYVTG
jgi:predicted secreted protein